MTDHITPRPWTIEHDPNADPGYMIVRIGEHVVGDIYQQGDAEFIIHAVNTFEQVREALETIASGNWEAMQTSVGKDPHESVALEGDYAADARGHYPYRMKVLYAFAKAALTAMKGGGIDADTGR